MEIINGELWVFYTDTTSQNLGSVGDTSDQVPEYYFAYQLDTATNQYKIGLSHQFLNAVTSLTIPSEYNGIPVTCLGGVRARVTKPDATYDVSVFGFTSSTLKSVTIPKSVTRIEKYAFQSATTTLQEAYFEQTTGWTYTSGAQTIEIPEETMSDPKAAAELLRKGYLMQQS